MLSTTFGEDQRDLAEQALKAYCDAYQVAPGSAASIGPMGDGFVYFVTCDVPDFPIKIGWAVNVEKRLAGLQTSMPYKLRVLATMEGTLDNEQGFHLAFGKDRLEGEWFKRSPELLDLIRRIRMHDEAPAQGATRAEEVG